MNIGVTGYKGLLGSELIRQGCLPVDADVTNFKLLQQASKPFDVVIHCAAMTNVDGCETAPALAAKVNTGGTYLLSQVFGGKIIYISTDFVFDGENGPYSEEDKPNPISVYGWSKLGGEIVIRNRKQDDLIIRISTPFGNHPRKQTLVSKITKRLEEGQPVTFPYDLTSSPVYVPRLATGILAAIDQVGILNIAGFRVMRLWEFARKVADIWGFHPIRIGNDGAMIGLAPRPLYGGLQIDKALELNIPIGDPLDGLVIMRNSMMEQV